MMASGSPSFFPSEQSGVYTKPQQQQQRQEALETETIDFTFVHAESDADEVDVVIDGGTMPNEGIEQPKGDILAVLLSGTAQQNGGEYITVRFERAMNVFSLSTWTCLDSSSSIIIPHVCRISYLE
jgi:hypothetical protein